MKPVDVFPGSSRLVEGEVPSESLLLLGPSGIGKTIFCKQFLYNGLIINEPSIYIATDESPEGIVKSMKLGGKSSSEYAVSNPADLATVSITIEKARQDLKKIRLVLDSITGLTSICNHNVTIFSKFVQIIIAKARFTNSDAIFTVTPEAHDPRFLSYLRTMFDGTLEMKADDSGKEVKRLLRIFSLKGAKHKTDWIPFEITNHGIAVKS